VCVSRCGVPKFRDKRGGMEIVELEQRCQDSMLT